jgi:hypothetical protein
MFINWFKSKYLKNDCKIRHCDYHDDNNDYNNLNNNEVFSQLDYFKSIFTSYNSKYNNHFNSLKNKSKFFSKYADHSIEIAEIIKKGYGNQDILGSVNDFEIIYPHEPKGKEYINPKIHL